MNNELIDQNEVKIRYRHAALRCIISPNPTHREKRNFLKVQEDVDKTIERLKTQDSLRALVMKIHKLENFINYLSSREEGLHQELQLAYNQLNEPKFYSFAGYYQREYRLFISDKRAYSFKDKIKLARQFYVKFASVKLLNPKKMMRFGYNLIVYPSCPNCPKFRQQIKSLGFKWDSQSQFYHYRLQNA